MSAPNILLYGAGSIGGVYLYQLLQAGCTVTAVCRLNYTTVKEHGFSLSSVRYGNVTYRPTAIARSISECQNEVFDYVLVCTKSFPDSRPSLAEQLAPVLQGRPDTAIVLAQNGIAIEEDLAAAFPGNAVLSGVIYCPAIQTGPGTIEYPEMLNLFELGTYPADAPEGQKDVARRFAGLMVKGGGNAEVHDNIQVARWSKLLMNAAWNPIGALTLTSDADFLVSAEPASYDLAWGIMMEIVELAKAVGVEGVTAEVARKKFEITKERVKTNSGREVSMLQDVRQGRQFEVEAILGSPLRLGKQKGVSMPRLETLYALAKARCWAIGKENSGKTV